MATDGSRKSITPKKKKILTPVRAVIRARKTWSIRMRPRSNAASASVFAPVPSRFIPAPCRFVRNNFYSIFPRRDIRSYSSHCSATESSYRDIIIMRYICHYIPSAKLDVGKTVGVSTYFKRFLAFRLVYIVCGPLL